MPVKGAMMGPLPSVWRRYAARLQGTEVGARLARGAFWSLVGSLGVRGMTLLATVVVVRLLGKEGYGELSVIQSTLGMFEVLAGLGMGLTATKYVAELRQRDPLRAGRVIALSCFAAAAAGLLLASAVAVAAPWLAAD